MFRNEQTNKSLFKQSRSRSVKLDRMSSANGSVSINATSLHSYGYRTFTITSTVAATQKGKKTFTPIRCCWQSKQTKPSETIFKQCRNILLNSIWWPIVNWTRLTPFRPFTGMASEIGQNNRLDMQNHRLPISNTLRQQRLPLAADAKNNLIKKQTLSTRTIVQVFGESYCSPEWIPFSRQWQRIEWINWSRACPLAAVHAFPQSASMLNCGELATAVGLTGLDDANVNTAGRIRQTDNLAKL